MITLTTKELTNFYGFLEDLATYNDFPIEEEDFLNKIVKKRF